MVLRSINLLLGYLIIGTVFGQYVPPDLYDEDYNKSIGFWENLGQVTTNGTPASGVKFYSEGGFPRAYLQDKSLVSFTMAVVDTNINTLDTLYRLDMRPYGSNAAEVDPQALIQKDWHQNFYMAHTDTAGAEEVNGYSRVVYEAIFPKIDMHFYSGSMGQKMAFVLRPECDPSDLQLTFEGQDSIAVDLWGNLKLYSDGKYMALPFVQAYQVDQNGTVTPVSWLASYDLVNGQGVVGFTWSNYNAAQPLVFQVGIPAIGPSEYDEEGLCWSTYLGGGERDDVYESVEDENGNYYIVGTTGSTFMSFPQSAGTNYASAGTVAYMLRFNSTDNIVWKTFFGGQSIGESTYGRGIGHKVDGEMYMAGFTDSESLPVFFPPGGMEFEQATATGPGYKGFIGRFSKTLGIREWASYYGENNVLINGMVGLDGKKIFIVGSTNSTVPALDVTAPLGSTYWPYSDLGDGFISMFNEDDQHAWRTHIPGTAVDVAYDVDAVDGRVVVAGMSHSEDLILQPFGNTSYSAGPFGEDDCFLYEFDEDGAIKWSTYVGSPGNDFSYNNGVAFDPVSRDIVLVGGGGFSLDVVPGPGWYQSSVPFGVSPGFIARFSGVDRARTWHTYAHNGPNSNVEFATCAFDPSGKLLLGGSVRDGDGTLLQPLSGLYQQSDFNADVNGGVTEYKDPLLMVFGPNNEFLYGSYFGGEAHAAFRELILTILHRRENGNIYFAGWTSKEADPTSYFPLDDGGGVPYFEENWQGSITEGFVAAICGGTLNEVGISDISTEAVTLASHWSHNSLLVFGLPDGQHDYEVLNAIGQCTVRGSAVSVAHIQIINLPPLAQGSYVVRTGISVSRFAVPE